MTATLPQQVREVFDRFITTEYVTIDGRGQPIAWPVTPYHHPESGCVDLTTGLGYPKKAVDAERNPRVALLFSDPTGSRLEDPPMVLVQGTARVDDDDLEANRIRYERESLAKLPGTQDLLPPVILRRRLMSWYFVRIYVHVRPERVYVWPRGDLDAEPELFDSHLEEVRSGHNEEPELPHAASGGAGPIWDARLAELGDESAPTAVISFEGPDGFPFAVRVPVRADPGAGVIRIEADPVGVPLESGRACLVAHRHSPDFSWQTNFQVRGDLVVDQGRWALVPYKLVGGFELPPGSTFSRYRLNAKKMLRFRKIAKAELARRSRR